MTTPCYYCDIRSVGTCKTCIHSDTYEEPKQPKPLSDEEIEECYWGDGYPDNPRHPKEFARAILRKAQEK